MIFSFVIARRSQGFWKHRGCRPCFQEEQQYGIREILDQNFWCFLRLFSSGGSRMIFTLGDLVCDRQALLLAGMGAVF